MNEQQTASLVLRPRRLIDEFEATALVLRATLVITVLGAAIVAGTDFLDREHVRVNYILSVFGTIALAGAVLALVLAVPRALKLAGQGISLRSVNLELRTNSQQAEASLAVPAPQGERALGPAQLLLEWWSPSSQPKRLQLPQQSAAALDGRICWRWPLASNDMSGLAEASVVSARVTIELVSGTKVDRFLRWERRAE